MIVMFDSVTVGEIPKGAQAVAGYVGGHWPTFAELDRLFPHAHRLSVAVSASEDADCLDIENGDAVAGQAPSWWERQHKRGVWRPCLYVELSNAASVVEHLTAAGIQRREYRLWVAHYTDSPHLEPGSDATQWTQQAFGRNLDESLCAPDFFPSSVPAPSPAAPRRHAAEVELDPASGEWRIAPLPFNAATLR